MVVQYLGCKPDLMQHKVPPYAGQQYSGPQLVPISNLQQVLACVGPDERDYWILSDVRKSQEAEIIG